MHLTLPVFLAVLTAAALHAGWNALIKIRLDPFLAMTLICFTCGMIALPALPITGLPKAAAWPWIVASVVIHLGYYLFLAEAYRRADMGQIYPIARGAAPLMTAIVSLFVVQDPLSTGNGVGILLLGAGVLLISLRGHRHLMAPSKVAVSCALLTAITISAYTIVDGIGARAAGDPNAYAAALFAVDAYPMLHHLPLLERGERRAPGAGFPHSRLRGRRDVARRLLDRHLGHDGRSDRARRGDPRDERAVRRADRRRLPEGADDAGARRLGRAHSRRALLPAHVLIGLSHGCHESCIMWHLD